VSLPLWKTDSKDITLLQSTWAKQLNPVIAQPMSQGNFLTSIDLAIGDNTIPHGLNRTLQGWIIVRIGGASTIYDKQASNSTPASTLVLNSSAAVTVNIFVF